MLTIKSARGSLLLVLLALTVTGAAGLACGSDGVVPSDNSSISTVTEPSGYIHVEIRPAKVVAAPGQQVRIECSLMPLIDTPVTAVSVELHIFDAEGARLREQVLEPGPGNVWSTDYRIVGDEAFARLLVVFDVGQFMDDPGTRYTEYTVIAVPIATDG